MSAHRNLTLAPAALALSLILQSPVAHAAVFAQFQPDTAAADFSWVNGGSGGTFDSGSGATPVGVATHFDFLDPSLSFLGFLPATFTLDAGVSAGHPAVDDGGGLFTQTNVDGSFSFIYSGPTQTIGSVTLTHGVTNLLSGVFTNAWIQGAGGSGSANRSAPVGSLTYTSDLEPFTGLVPNSEEFAFNLLSVSPGFGAAVGKALNTATASGGGNFSFVSVRVPEPASWTLMIVGFGLAGAGLRARRRFAPA
jgi:hypothetical protein